MGRGRGHVLNLYMIDDQGSIPKKGSHGIYTTLDPRPRRIVVIVVVVAVVVVVVVIVLVVVVVVVVIVVVVVVVVVVVAVVVVCGSGRLPPPSFTGRPLQNR